MSLSRAQHGFGHDSSEGEHGCCEALLTKHTSARPLNTAEGLALNPKDPKISPGEQHPANTNSYCWQGRKLRKHTCQEAAESKSAGTKPSQKPEEKGGRPQGCSFLTGKLWDRRSVPAWAACALLWLPDRTPRPRCTG